MMEEFLFVISIQFIIEIIIFLVLILIGSYALNKLKHSSHRFLNPQEYLPEEEIHTLKQVFYLIIMSLLFVDFIYSIVYFKSDVSYLALLDIVLSMYIVITVDKSTWKNRIIAFFLLPFGSLTYLLFSYSIISIFDFIHVPILLYCIVIYYRKFKEYTENNGLGIAVLLLFAIIFFSFFFTMYVESENPLDSLVMVSNAFTSNGYAVLGKSVVGKLNSLFLVWGGYVISGAGTAALTATILLRYFNKRIKKLEQLIDDEGDEI